MTERLGDRTSHYLVELEMPEAGWSDVDLLIRRAREATASPAGDARFVRAIFVPEDSTCFLLYAASSAQAAAQAAIGIDMGVERVSEVVQTTDAQVHAAGVT